MTLAPDRSASPKRPTPVAGPDTSAGTPVRPRVGAYPWAMAGAVALSVAGAALTLNGVLRGWAWYVPVLATVVVVCLSIATLRALRAHPLLVAAGGLLSLVAVLTLTFFRSTGIAGFIPTGSTLAELHRFIRRASETVLGETAPVAPDPGIVMVICAALGLAVILIDALAVPLGMPGTTGVGLLAILVVPAVVKPQSVGVWGFTAAAAGYLLILAFSQRFAPAYRTSADSPGTPGQFRLALLTGALALAATLAVPPAIPGFEHGTFPQGSRLTPWGSGSGLNPMITLGSSLRTPAGNGRITYATNATTPLYLRSVTVDHFDGESWEPDDREAERLPLTGTIDTGYEIRASEQLRHVTAVRTGTFTSPYLPLPYAPESVRGLAGRWTWDPATLAVKASNINSRGQLYVVSSTTPKLTAEMLQQSSASARGISKDFTRLPGDVPEIVRSTADTVTASSGTAYAKAMAIQRYLRSGEFAYSLQSPVQEGYDGNGLSVLADFLNRKSGYCIHYSSAMAVMARLKGIPSRIAVGYAPGRPTGTTVSVPGEGALPEFEVDSRDAHAWPELYFQGLGWVPFEPTPSRGVVPAYAPETASAGSPALIDNNDGLVPGSTPAPLPTASATTAPLPGVRGEGPDVGQRLLPWLLTTTGALAVCLLAASPRLIRIGRRARRLGRQALASDDAVPLAWSELRDIGTDYGLPPEPSDTPRTYSARLLASELLGGAGSLSEAAHQAVLTLTSDFERRHYGRPVRDTAMPGAPGTLAARIGAVQRSVRENASFFRRFRADWLPASVLGWWGRFLASPVRTARGLAVGTAEASARSRSRARSRTMRH